MRGSRKRRITALLMLLCILAGCAPRERTMLLPQKETELAEEGEAAAEDYTVKKIYTYEYKSWPALERSAFLQGCRENEINVIALEEQEGGEEVVGRRVDYRYGFHDMEGVFFRPWENWKEEQGGEMAGDLYVDQMVPSPDGRQMLVYVRSVFWGTCMVWLCDMEVQKALLLYHGTADDGGKALIGSFSPSGRWAAYDVLGKLSEDAEYIAVYECQKAVQAAEIAVDASLEGFREAEIYPPDRQLPVLSDGMTYALSGELFDNYDGTGAGLLNLAHVNGDQLRVRSYAGEDWDGTEWLYHWETDFFLDWDMGTFYPYPRYTLDAGEKRIYYLEGFRELWQNDMGAAESKPDDVWKFPDMVLDFWRMESGEMLVLSTRETAVLDEKREMNTNSNAGMWVDAFNLYDMQMRGQISSADLYLYSPGETEGRLLYKNIQNVIHMEYDEATRRILLETCENGDMNYRKCIILEL